MIKLFIFSLCLVPRGFPFETMEACNLAANHINSQQWEENLTALCLYEPEEP